MTGNIISVIPNNAAPDFSLRNNGTSVGRRALSALLLAIGAILFIPAGSYAETFYNCINQAGEKTMSNYPLAGHICTPIGTVGEMPKTQVQNRTQGQEKSVLATSREKTTNIVIKGNSILVPVTIVYGSIELPVQLLLDTGASGTTINTEIADRLFINPDKAIKIKGIVVGGGTVDAAVIKISSLTVGPHIFRDRNIFIVPHKGSAAKFDGLLGMDVLKELKYKIDFQNRVILWE